MNNKFINKLNGNIYYIGKALDMYIPLLTERAKFFKKIWKEKKKFEIHYKRAMKKVGQLKSILRDIKDCKYLK